MFFQKNFRISTYGPQMNNILAKPVDANEWPDIPELFEYMLRVIRVSGGVGLAAPQIGLSKQFVLVENDEHRIIGLVNPEITRLYGKEIKGSENCLSLPPAGNGCMVPRLDIVDVEASLAESPHIRRQFTFRDEVARIVQHELDHLTGTFFADRVSDIRRKSVLDKFHYWKSMRIAQTRKREENVNVNTGSFTVNSGQPRVS
jgi:peptide deformylase